MSELKPKVKESKHKLFIGPFLFSVFPVLFLIQNNLEQIPLSAALRCLLLSILIMGFVYLLILFFMKNRIKAATIALIIEFFFFTYGHLYSFLNYVTIFGILIGRHRFLAPIWTLLMIGLILLVIKKGIPVEVYKIISFSIIALNIIILFRIANSVFLNYQVSLQSPKAIVEKTNVPQELPDIYWIVLDGYTREDVLLKDFNFNNEDFLNDLTRIGFIVPECTQSNYPLTVTSISSTLNMDYLENISTKRLQTKEKTNYNLFRNLIMNSKVRQELAAYGYKTVAFETGFNFIEITNADYYIQNSDHSIENSVISSNLTEFEFLFIRTTFLRILDDFPSFFARKTSELTGNAFSPEKARYEFLQKSYNNLEMISDLPEPKFVYSHIMATHIPFVLNEKGEFVIQEDDKLGYVDSIKFTNFRITNIIEKIIKNSKVPPIIILQADHGHNEDSKTLILNAYYLPRELRKFVYPNITPVNTFRLILGHYFHEPYPLLEDRSYLNLDPNDRTNFTQVKTSCTNN